MRTVAIVQARVGSSRLPDKVLADIADKPLLTRVIERVGAARLIDEIIVATTTGDADRAVVDVAESCRVAAFRGSSDDVLDRFHGAAHATEAEVVVRITADDPLKDPEVVDLITGELLDDDGLDYVSNTLEPSWPEGLDVECFTAEALDRAWREARRPSEREHVTPYIWNHPDVFSLRSVRHEIDLSTLRWTVDYPDDLAFVRAVYERLAPKEIFGMQAVLELIGREPELTNLNAGHRRGEGYERSVASEQREVDPCNE